MWKYSFIVVIAALLYTWINYTHRNLLLVLLQVDGGNIDRLKEIYNVEAVFKIERNIDGHMDIGNDGEVDQHNISEKLKWNFILLTKSFPSEQSSLKFGDNLRRYNFIKSFSIFAFTSSPIRVKAINAIFLLKGFIGSFIPSFHPTFTKEDTMEDENDLEALCTDEHLGNEQPNIIVNIIKVKDEEELEKYQKTVVFQMFPALGTSVFAGGLPKSDYWDQIGIIMYRNRASLCQMVLSKEFLEVLPHKQRGLEDTHTYLTTRIL